MASVRPSRAELEAISLKDAGEAAEFSGKRVATRHRLMDACSEIIVEEGFSAVSMSSVAEKAGITRQTVYGYFSNARAVIWATLIRGGREVLEGQLLVLAEKGEPRELLVEAVMTALRLINESALHRKAWASADFPHLMLRATVDPAYMTRAVEGLRPIARELGWSEKDTWEAYEIIARTVVSLLITPPPSGTKENELRDILYRRLIPALGA